MIPQQPWTIIFYTTGRGDCPVKDYIAGITDPKEQATVLRCIDLLEQFGVLLKGSDVTHIEDKLWELRPVPHRIFYFIATGRRCVLLSAYRKKSQKTPKREIDRAKAFLADWLERERDD